MKVDSSAPALTLDIELRIHNPEAGREDRYVVTLSRERMTFGNGARVANCTGQQGEDPEWEDEERPKSILKGDSICPPAGFAKMLVRVWVAWLDGDLDDHAAVAELELLADWLNHTTRTMPRSKFWRRNI